MLRNDRTRRQEVLEVYIKIMAGRLLIESDLKKVATDLRDDVYNDGFEHCEPELFTLISEMFKEDDKYNLDFLSINIIQLQNFIETDCAAGNEEFIGIADHVDKLCDYINLEIGRLNYYLINNSKIMGLETKISVANEDVNKAVAKFKDLEIKISDVNSSVSEATDKLGTINEISDDVKEKVQNLQRDSITILGIFASIVLTFTGGMIFSSSVLENIGNASAYRIIIIALIIGLVVINSVISLIMYIGKIVRFKDERKIGIKEWLSGNVYWISVNIIFVGLIILTYVGWLRSTEKELLDQSNRYQIEMHHKNTEELNGNSYSVSDNNLEE